MNKTEGLGQSHPLYDKHFAERTLGMKTVLATFVAVFVITGLLINSLVNEVVDEYNKYEAQVEAKRAAFMADCIKDKKQYECDYMASKIF
jgi:hypothetical protein